MKPFSVYSQWPNFYSQKPRIIRAFWYLKRLQINSYYTLSIKNCVASGNNGKCILLMVGEVNSNAGSD